MIQHSLQNSIIDYSKPKFEIKTNNKEAGFEILFNFDDKNISGITEDWMNNNVDNLENVQLKEYIIKK